MSLRELKVALQSHLQRHSFLQQYVSVCARRGTTFLPAAPLQIITMIADREREREKETHTDRDSDRESSVSHILNCGHHATKNTHISIMYFY